MGGYFTRQLHEIVDGKNGRQVDEDGVIATTGPRIVLGEPGMGKTEFVREIGRRLGVEPVTASRFIAAVTPAKFVIGGKPLLIDGLDEAMARREDDVITKVVSQLEAAGTPPFILCCRAREWQSRTVTSLSEVYGQGPAVFALEPLTREEAQFFLIQRHPQADANHVLDHLDQHGLAELYRNPLTLGLMGRVAVNDQTLPATRAALFERVCELTWPEHDLDRQDLGLAQLSVEQALDGAGAICAALLLAGAETVSIEGAAQMQAGDLRLSDIETLPGGAAVRVVYSSKLFHSVGICRAKPIHRVIAEYLGARYLARHAANPRAQRRLLAQLHGSGTVPSSLRGLNAWLAYHSTALALLVIDADPYGVLRYGETASLTPSQADQLFKALCALADDNPYFRAADWDNHTAAGLMIPAMRQKIDDFIGSGDSNAHLRSLLIEALDGSPLAEILADTLQVVMMSTGRFFREREDAAGALLPLRDVRWWHDCVQALHDQGTEDSTRLARHIAELLDWNISNALLVAVLFAEMGATIYPVPRGNDYRASTVRSYRKMISGLTVDRIPAILDLITDYLGVLEADDWENRRDIADIVARLLIRQLDENERDAADGMNFWRWLAAIDEAHRFHGSTKTALEARLAGDDVLRRAIQHHALYEQPRGTLWSEEGELRRRLVDLGSHESDIAHHLEMIADADNRDAGKRQDWCDLMRLARHRKGMDPSTRTIGVRFMRDDPELRIFLEKLESDAKPHWLIKQEERAEKQRRKRLAEVETQRRNYGDKRTEIRNGETSCIIGPAKAYLGIYSDITRDQPPAGRLTEWLGLELCGDALAGFEAILHRHDLPHSEQVATGFATGTMYDVAFAIVAGLLERVRWGRGLDGVPNDVLITGLLLAHNQWHGSQDDDFPVLIKALESRLLVDMASRIAFARRWIEPALHARCKIFRGLHKLAHEDEWIATGGVLAAEWLERFPDLPDNVEMDLIDCLTHAGEFDRLAEIAARRSTRVFEHFEKMLGWLAVEVLVRFEDVRNNMTGIGEAYPDFLWYLRNRVRLERRGALLPLSVAQTQWIIETFRAAWPYVSMLGSSSGDTNAHDATDFLRALIFRLADDVSQEAAEAMRALIATPEDSYSDTIRHMAAEQRQKRAEADFHPVAPAGLKAMLDEGPPINIDDLKAAILEELGVVQRKLLGDDLDQVRDFWDDAGIPRNENRCRDRLTAMFAPELLQLGVQRMPEADMPMTKRADLAFARKAMQLPVEVKGQWHDDVWDAARGQLDARYLIDWRSEGRGIFLAMWFGDVPSSSGRRIKPHPDGLPAPTTPEEMREMLIARIPEARRPQIDVVVLDCSVGKPKEPRKTVSGKSATTRTRPQRTKKPSSKGVGGETMSNA